MAAASIAPKPEPLKLTETEKWIVDRVRAGDIADLKDYPNKKDRELSTKFLEDLLTGAVLQKPHRNGVRIKNAIFNDPVNLTGAQLIGDIWLDDCQFNEAVTFEHATFGGQVSLERTLFKREANFAAAKFKGEAFLQKTVFEGPVNFRFADFARFLNANEAQFKDKTKGVDFDSVTVGDSVFLNDAVFEGPLDCGLANIASNLEIVDARFKSAEEAVTFNSAKVGHSVFCERSVFEGPVDFAGMEVAGGFSAQAVRFTNAKSTVNFNGLKLGDIALFQGAIFDGSLSFIGGKLGDTANFDNAVFKGSVDFSATDIARDFLAEGAQFVSQTQAVLLSVKCGRKGVFTGASFAGVVTFEDSSFLDLILGDTSPSAASIPKLDLSRSVIKRQLRIRRITVIDLEAQSMHVDGPAEFKDVTVNRSVNLSYAEFITLDLSGSVWPKDSSRCRLLGMTYKYIGAASNEFDSHKRLLELVDRSSYTADAYGNLEQFFWRQGYRGDADRVFIAGKVRERKEYTAGIRRLGSWILDWLVGYGRHPSNAGYFCAFFVGLGWILFPAKKMELRRSAETGRVYSRFWYSLGLFLPFVDLQADKVWKPKKSCWFLRNYVRVHILLGWILIPILLAALTGLIK